MLVDWVCHKCQLNYSLPDKPVPRCYMCNAALVKKPQASVSDAAPPLPPRYEIEAGGAPPLPPRHEIGSGGAPPLPPRHEIGSGSRPPLPPRGSSRGSGGDAATLNGMVDYFTAYLPAMVRNTSLTTPSKHRAYLNSLLFSHRFVQSSNENGFSDPRGYIQKTEDLCKQRHQRLTRQGVVITHIYDQRLDARIYTLSTTVKGWCLGIAAYWIKHKRNGDNPFPKTIYTSSELSKETGVPIQLMKNQDKLTKFFQGQTNVAPKGVAWNVKNALDYIAGGRYSNAGPVIDFKLHRGGRKLKDMCRQFFGLLAPKSAPGHVRARDRFIVVLNLESGGHLAALDMVDVEYFDPNFGVMTTLKKNRKALVEFIFGSLSQVCYQGNSINSIQMYRIE